MDLTRPKTREHFIYAQIFSNEFTFFAVLPFLSSIEQLGAFKVGAILGGSLILESVLMLVFSSRLPTVSARTVFTLNSGLMFVAWSVLIASPGVAGIITFYVLISISKGLLKPLARTALMRLVGQAASERAFQNISMIQNLSIVVAPLVGSAAVFGDASTVFLVFLAIYGGLFVLSLVVFGGSQLWIESSGGSILKGVFQVLRIPETIGLVMSIFAAFMIMGLFITGTVLIPDYRPSLSPYVGIFFSVVGVSIVAWRLLFHRFVPVSVQKNAVVLSVLGASSAFFFFGDLWISIACLAAYAVFETTIIPMIYSSCSHAVDERFHSLAFSCLLIAGSLGEAVGSLVSGYVIGAVQDPETILALIVGFLAVASVVALFAALGRTTSQEQVQ